VRRPTASKTHRHSAHAGLVCQQAATDCTCLRTRFRRPQFVKRNAEVEPGARYRGAAGDQINAGALSGAAAPGDAGASTPPPAGPVAASARSRASSWQLPPGETHRARPPSLPGPPRPLRFGAVSAPQSALPPGPSRAPPPIAASSPPSQPGVSLISGVIEPRRDSARPTAHRVLLHSPQTRFVLRCQPANPWLPGANQRWRWRSRYREPQSPIRPCAQRHQALSPGHRAPCTAGRLHRLPSPPAEPASSADPAAEQGFQHTPPQNRPLLPVPVGPAARPIRAGP